MLEALFELGQEENRHTSRADQWQAPLERHTGWRERSRHCGPVRVPAACAPVLLGACAHDLDVREDHGRSAQELTSPPVRLEQDEAEVGARRSEGNSGRAAARADVDHRTTLEERERRQRVVDVDPPEFVRISDRRQPGSLGKCLEPGPETRVADLRRG